MLTQAHMNDRRTTMAIITTFTITAMGTSLSSEGKSIKL